MNDRYFAIERLSRELLELLDSAEVKGNGYLPEHEFDAMYDYARLMLKRELEPARGDWTEQDYRAHEADMARKSA